MWSSWARALLRQRQWRQPGATAPPTSPSFPGSGAGGTRAGVSIDHCCRCWALWSTAGCLFGCTHSCPPLPTPAPRHPFDRRMMMPFSRSFTVTALNFMPFFTWAFKQRMVLVRCAYWPRPTHGFYAASLRLLGLSSPPCIHPCCSCGAPCCACCACCTTGVPAQVLLRAVRHGRDAAPRAAPRDGFLWCVRGVQFG